MIEIDLLGNVLKINKKEMIRDLIEMGFKKNNNYKLKFENTYDGLIIFVKKKVNFKNLEWEEIGELFLSNYINM